MAIAEILSDNPRRLYKKSFIVDGTGTAAITFGGELGTLVDNGTGDYTITFQSPFAANPYHVSVSPLGTVGTVTYGVHTDTNSTKVRLIFSADTKFYVSVEGVKDPQ